MPRCTPRHGALTPAQIRALSMEPWGGKTYFTVSHVPTHTCLALIRKGMIKCVLDPETGDTIGHRITDKGRTALNARLATINTMKGLSA